MKHQTQFVLLTVLLLSGCGPRQVHSSGDDKDDDNAETPDLPEPTPDLPCGGADLQTDDDNCGECGNECPLYGAGDYESGGCTDGACGPTWQFAGNWTETETLTCADACAGLGMACDADACAGLTGFVCEAPFDLACGTLSEGADPLAKIEGSCANPLEWPAQAVNDQLRVFCCCG